MRAIIVVIFAFICFESKGQKWSAGLDFGYGSYNMNSLRQKEASFEGSVIPYKQVQNFPATPFVRGYTRVKIQKIFSTGIMLGYLRTGSRSAYSDYSGSAYRDFVVNGIQVASSNLFQVYSMDKYLINARLNVGAVFNSTDFTQSISLNGGSYNEERYAKFTSLNPYFSFGADITRTFGRFALALFAEYELNGLGNMKLKSSNFSTTPLSDFDVDWSGARVGLSCTFQFAKEP